MLDQERQLGMSDLPEACLARILSFTTPQEACRLAAVCRSFRAASESDTVWDKMLPPRYPEIIESAEGGPIHFYSKKELYLRLCNVPLRKNSKEIYWLHRSTGRECHMLSARGLSIIWGDDLRYWFWAPRDGSRFQEVACLKQVCWLEVRGQFQWIFQPNSYTVSFRFQMSQTYGWDGSPVKFSLSTSNGQHVESICNLTQKESEADESCSEASPLRYVDGWMEYDAGEFFVEEDGAPIELQFDMLEIQSGKWKSGFFLDGVMIRPSESIANVKVAPSNIHTHPPQH